MSLPIGGTLALDLDATTVGWAYGPVDWLQPAFGYWRLRQSFRQARYAAFVDILNDFMDLTQPKNVCIERPFPPARWLNAEACFQVYAIVGFVEEACFRHAAKNLPHTPLSGEHVDTIRNNVIGKCRWGNRALTKAAVMRFCRENLKLEVNDDNAADAIIVWHDYRQKMLGIPPAQYPLLRELGPDPSSGPGQ